ncbi:MAG: hypothetical protein MUP55_04245 [Candidatus Aenigmarchaeota archaeon]|nr:hypothetical protein [Candidatus Aenigmarchaeota archaeon]
MAKYDHGTYRVLKTLTGMSKVAMESQQNLQRVLNRKVSDFDSNATVLNIVEEIDGLRGIYYGKMQQLERYLESFNKILNRSKI